MYDIWVHVGLPGVMFSSHIIRQFPKALAVALNLKYIPWGCILAA
jgi:hypothetical protein